MINTQNKLTHKEYFAFENSILVRDFVQQAFLNLLKTKEPFTKDKLIGETKRLFRKNVLEQIRKNKSKLISKQ
jgi:hypothetical protein